MLTSLPPTVNIKGKIDPTSKELKPNVTIGVKGRVEF